jgi:hypothetical protein
MANDIITPTGRSLDVATLMNTALAPFTLRDQWCSAIQEARRAKDFVTVGADGELVALSDDADWIASRTRAIEIRQKLPPHAEIVAAYRAANHALRVKPSSGEYQLLTSKMLDVLGIKGGDDTDAYVEAMAWTLADVWRGNRDPSDAPEWIPIPAFAKAIKRTWGDRAAWNHFGRPPAIPSIIEHCKDYRRDLVYARDNIDMLARTSHRLDTIISTVNAYETEKW